MPKYLVIGATIALVSALIGYLFRRSEHHREQRLDAYRSLLAAFLDAAKTGAELISVHTQTGYPSELNRKELSTEDIDMMTKIHSEDMGRGCQCSTPIR